MSKEQQTLPSAKETNVFADIPLMRPIDTSLRSLFFPRKGLECDVQDAMGWLKTSRNFEEQACTKNEILSKNDLKKHDKELKERVAKVAESQNRLDNYKSDAAITVIASAAISAMVTLLTLGMIGIPICIALSVGVFVASLGGMIGRENMAGKKANKEFENNLKDLEKTMGPRQARLQALNNTINNLEAKQKGKNLSATPNSLPPPPSQTQQQTNEQFNAITPDIKESAYNIVKTKDVRKPQTTNAAATKPIAAAKNSPGF